MESLQSSAVADKDRALVGPRRGAVTTLDAMAFPTETIARLYRERADAENIECDQPYQLDVAQ
jgi:hypothetical protein